MQTQTNEIMSENINLKQLPHHFLLNKYNINPAVLSEDAKQMIKDLEKTIRLVAMKSSEGNVNLTPATQQKITTYDRFICDGIFEYLEEQDKLSEIEADKLEEQMDGQRDVVQDQLEAIHTEALNELESRNEQETEQKETEHSAEPNLENHADGEAELPKVEKVKIGFWEWE